MLDAYRRLLRSRRDEVLEHGTPAFYRGTVAATFSLAYEQVLVDAPLAAEVLRTCAFLAPDDIPTELVSGGDALSAEAAFAALRRLALVRRQSGSLTVHRLVGAVVRDRLGPQVRERHAEAATAALKSAFPHPADDHRSWPRSARLLPHVLALAEHPEATGASLASLLHQLGV